ncbi:RNA polymerase subunit RPO19 [Carp edema virus]|nr:RNA polymerase subunit RPO19 [Carp edema virus]
MDEFSPDDFFQSDEEFDSEQEFSLSEEEEEEEEDSEEENLFDISTISQIEEISNIDETSNTNLKKVENSRKNYIFNRLGEYAIVGMMSHRYNQIVKGSIPLCINSKDYYEKYTPFIAILDEIKQGVFPVVIKKGEYYIKITDFPYKVVQHRLEIICDYWKEQRKIPMDYSPMLFWEN